MSNDLVQETFSAEDLGVSIILIPSGRILFGCFNWNGGKDIETASISYGPVLKKTESSKKPWNRGGSDKQRNT